MLGPGETELWPWEGGDSGEAGPLENPSENKRGPGGQRPSVSSHPTSAMSVHRGRASGCPERGVLSKNVGHHLWGLQRPRDRTGCKAGSLKGWPLVPSTLDGPGGHPLRLFPVSKNGDDNTCL